MKEKINPKLFQEVQNPEDKLRLLSDVSSLSLPLKVRVSDKVTFETRSKAWAPPNRMEVTAPNQIKLGLQELTVQFDCHDERYFSRVDLAFDDWKLFFLFTKALYRLQRRQYQRLRIPVNYPNQTFLMSVNNELWNEQCEILDMSLGGCSLNLSYRSLNLPIGAVLMLDMKVGEVPSTVVIGQVCYKRLQKMNGQSRVKIGVQFRPHPKYSSILELIIQRLAVDIFSGWSKRK